MHDIHVSPHRLRLAARTLAAGGIVAHATEGVWGLAADAYDPDAVWRVLAAKRRDAARGLIVVAADASQLAPLVDPRADAAWRRAVESWPGPTTWLLPARRDAPWWLTGGRATIALRETAHGLTRALCAEFDGPIVSTSANVTGRPPVASAWRARARFGDRIDLVLGGEPDTPGRPSTIRNAVTDETVRG
ncbi:L-threonylcarbamoyladenylate synthase [Salinisphaera sp.]|uniref:L-threonylcarbamoyladenylate synthase n=1 Tax=Salinisphaera sp. TaxID=1914330 RepID=UPI002D77309D|nr:L-threonylcarbamoyladenylate synthase [Salinisphaera sp.]HET7314568.1 L-threonylcarbamoyladenylate synthase [Salinisphaera sp.]